MSKELKFEHMCDKCFRFLDENEDKFAIKIYDDVYVEKMFQGHKVCMDYLSKELPLIFKQEREAD